jgi:hypothetical protein
VPDRLSFPLRLDANGRLVTVDVGTDAADAEGVAQLINTERGERELVPDYGVTDAAFRGAQPVDVAEVNAGLDLFGPPVRVTNIATEVAGPTVLRVAVEFE